MSINVTYQANYNGFSFDDIEEDTPQTEKCIEVICDHLYNECDEDGYFCGSYEEATTFITNEVQKVFGDVEVNVTFDTFSS